MTRQSHLLVVSLALFAACGQQKPTPPARSASIPASARVAASSEIPGDAGARPPWSSAYPPARVVNARERHWSVEVGDSYRWLEDGKSSEVQQWSEAEDKLARKYLDALPERPILFSRLNELLHTEARAAPVRRGNRLFFAARNVTQDKSVLYWRGPDGKDNILLDPNTWPKKDNPSLTAWYASWDGKKIAYAVSLHNADESTLHVRDIDTGVESARDEIYNLIDPDVSWSPDTKGFYYRFTPPAPDGTPKSQRAAFVELRYHRIGGTPEHDTIVREKTGDATVWPRCRVSRDGHWLFANVFHGDVSSENYFRDLRPGAKSKGGWRTLARADHGLVFVRAHRDRFYVLTNDQAPNWRILVVDPASPERDKWKEIVSERQDSRLKDFEIVGNKLVLKYLKDVVTRLEIHALDGSLLQEVALPEPGTASIPKENPDSDETYFEFSSFTHAQEIYRLSVASGTTDLWHRTQIPADLSRFETRQTFYTSKDGTQVPIFLVHAKNMQRDGKAPTLLSGYGGFNISFGPQFSGHLIPWLERGGVYAWAGIRGGGEYGETWHQGGMLHKKQNTFDDFIAAAEFLIHEQYTTSERLAVLGGSNGGLLMGAVATQRPDLFRVVLCYKPVLDMIRYPLLGPGRNWLREYGDPEKEADFRALFAYSPIHHISPGIRYPSFLVTAFANDDRVDPAHARKFVAALQAASTGGPVLLRIEQDAGHMGADSQRSTAALYADQFAFALAEIAQVGRVMKAK